MNDDNVDVRMLQAAYQRQSEDIARLKSGGGGGTSGGMEERVKRLEADVSDIKKLVTDIRVTLASIDERTKHMPTHWQAFGIFLGSLAGMGAIVALTARFLQ